MAVQTYSYDDISDAFSGYYNETVTGSKTFAQNAVIFMYITGTEATLKVTSDLSIPFSVYVDGTRYLPTISNGEITLFSFLTDTVHTVSINPYSDDITTIDTTETELLTVTSDTPSITNIPMDYVSWDTFNGISTQPKTTLTDTDLTPQFPQVQPSTAARGQIIFNAQCDTIYLFSNATTIYYSVDDGTIQTATGNTHNYRNVAEITGFDNTSEHKYIIWDGADRTYPIQGIACVSNGVPVEILNPSSNETSLYMFGDSITYGLGADPGDVDIWQIGINLDCKSAKMGVSGQTINGLTTMLPDYLNEIDASDYALIAIGRNDTSSFTIQSDYEACIQAFLDSGFTRLICRGILPEDTELWTSQNAEIEAAVNSFANNDIVFIDTSTWLGIETADGTHPTAIGYGTIVTYEEPALEAILATSYQITGITYDKDGNIQPSVQVSLFKHSGSGVYSYVATQTSDATTGAYDFSGLTDNDSSYMIYAHLDDTTNTFDCSDNNLTPVEE